MVYITDYISEAAVFEQLAEECAELGQAALKLARIKRGENPTPITMTEAYQNFSEEVADVRNLLSVIKNEIFIGGLYTDKQQRYKMKRWRERLKTAHDKNDQR